MRKFLTWAVLAAIVVGMQSGAVLAAGKKGNRTPEDMFKRLDRNNDGKLTADEMQGKKAKGDPEKAKKRFAHLDKNSDGGVTLEEFKAHGKKK